MNLEEVLDQGNARNILHSSLDKEWRRSSFWLKWSGVLLLSLGLIGSFTFLFHLEDMLNRPSIKTLITVSLGFVINIVLLLLGYNNYANAKLTYELSQDYNIEDLTLTIQRTLRSYFLVCLLLLSIGIPSIYSIVDEMYGDYLWQKQYEQQEVPNFDPTVIPQ